MNNNLKMYDTFRKVVENIFNNWTGLRMAVEHSMAGPDSKEVAIKAVDDITRYCVDYDVEVEDIEDQLLDLMDQQFHTECEDDSICEIARIMHRFLTLIQENNTAQLEIEYNSLPSSGKDWLTVQQSAPRPARTEEPMEDVEMDEEPVDPGWTQVKSKKRK